MNAKTALSDEVSMDGGKEPLTVARIVSVAKRIMELSGVGSVTMRRVASDLGVTAMALYNHVSDKQALLALVADSVISGVPDYENCAAPWEVRLLDEFMAVHDEINRYPGLGLYIASAPGFYPSGLRKFRKSLGLLMSAGFNEDEALAATYLLLAYQGGYFLLAHPAGGVAASGGEKADDGPSKADMLLRHDLRRGLETIIAGLQSQLATKLKR